MYKSSVEDGEGPYTFYYIHSTVHEPRYILAQAKEYGGHARIPEISFPPPTLGRAWLQAHATLRRWA